MKYEDRFETGETVDLDVKDYPKGAFKYKPLDADGESDWLPKYMKMDLGTGKPIADLKMLNKLKVNQIVEVPYSPELIKKISGLDKAWIDMTMEEKWNLLGKLKGPELDNVIVATNNVGKKEADIKKE